MRQLSLFDTTDDAHGLAGVVPAVRAAMNAAAGASEEGRKLLVDSLSALAASANVRLTAGNAKSISKDTLDKWLSPSDRDHPPSILSVVALCMATGDAGAIRAMLRPLGLDVMTNEDRKLRDYGLAVIDGKAKAKAKRRMEEELLEGVK
jgi:2-oxoglutarate dehydrogenase complex dehydrogenase (E1) component-like enzyme